LLRIVVTSIVLAILGVLYIIANPSDPGVRGFGWFLVVLGSILAAVFTYLWVKKQTMDEPTEKEDKDRRDSTRGRGKKGRRRR
jgi:Na+-driven multidrug efflux pump